MLSGGERARLAMAKLILKPYNLLALDEPTNHMDLISKDVLKRALQSYEGTLILVSHDRDFLDGLADKVFEFKDGTVREHLGGLSDFLSRKNISTLEQLEDPGPGLQINDNRREELSENLKSEGALSYLQQKEAEREQKRKRSKIEKCEEEIGALEKKIMEIERLLSANDTRVSLPQTLEEYGLLKETLDKKLEEWEKLHD